MKEEFYCPRGPGPGSRFKAPFNGVAEWRTKPDGSRTCSYCGSLHPDDFTEIMRAYADGDGGYHFSTTTKSYKLYGNRPGVQNASQGGIKFYGPHLQGIDRTEFDAQHRRAFEKFAAEMRERFGS